MSPDERFGYLSVCPNGMDCGRHGCLRAHVPDTRRNRPMTLTDFLLERFAEDEDRDLHLLNCPYGRWGGVDDCECGTGSRLRAECEAKRLVLAHASSNWRHNQTMSKILALPYADHPDYREEWKP